jgi:hypothetical protein
VSARLLGVGQDRIISMYESTKRDLIHVSQEISALLPSSPR